MARKALLLLAVAAFVGMASAAMAQEAETHATEMAEKVGNTVCPVCNAMVTEDNAVMVEHGGKVYSVCCAACKEKFMSDPETYAALADAQVAAMEASGAAEEAATMEMEAEGSEGSAMGAEGTDCPAE